MNKKIMLIIIISSIVLFYSLFLFNKCDTYPGYVPVNFDLMRQSCNCIGVKLESSTLFPLPVSQAHLSDSGSSNSCIGIKYNQKLINAFQLHADKYTAIRYEPPEISLSSNGNKKVRVAVYNDGIFSEMKEVTLSLGNCTDSQYRNQNYFAIESTSQKIAVNEDANLHIEISAINAQIGTYICQTVASDGSNKLSSQLIVNIK